MFLEGRKISFNMSNGEKKVFIFVISKKRKRYFLALKNRDTLDDLHDKIHEVYNLDPWHLWAFYLSNKAWKEPGYYSRDCDEGPFASDVTIEELNFIPKKKFLYLFDFGSQFTLHVYLEEIIKEADYVNKYVNSKKKTMRLIE